MRTTTYLSLFPLPYSLPVLLPLLLTATITLPTLTHTYPRFKDVSLKAGLQTSKRPTNKYGGATLADVDADGHIDLLLGHHDDGHIELYINNRNGTFRKSPWRGPWRDIHGINPFRRTPWHKRLHFAISEGGSYGRHPRPPLIFRYAGHTANLPPHSSGRRRRRSVADRVIDVTNVSGVKRAKGRGRSAVIMHLAPRPRRHNAVYLPDLAFTNVGKPDWSQRTIHAFRSLPSPRFQPRALRGLSHDPNWYATAADVDNDGNVELISYHHLRFYKVTAPFTVKDITSTRLPPSLDARGVIAVAELDFDNDGLWDLYVARTITGELAWLPKERDLYNDYLLRNTGSGRFVDVAPKVGLPTWSQTRGVTTGDVNNDGWTDIILSRFNEPDVVLLNDRGKRFRPIRNALRSIGTARPHRHGGRTIWKRRIPGDMVTAVDYDRDGRVDLIVSEGHTHDRSRRGVYRIVRNVGALRGHFLHVHVGNSPRRLTTSLHAVVAVTVKVRSGKKRWTGASRTVRRRVGSPGTAVSNSLVEVLHFGLGGFAMAANVKVQWANGERLTRYNVKAGACIRLGKF